MNKEETQLDVTMESIITELMLNGGDARGFAIEAIKAAERQDFDGARERLDACEEALTKAHHFQTGILQDEARGDSPVEVNLLMMHAQDHLMNAITIRDMAVQMIAMYRVIYQEKR